MDKNYTSENTNNYFTELDKYSLIDLLTDMKDYLLEYRKNIGISKNSTFGTELEYESLSKIKVDNFCMENLYKWRSKSDASLKSGGEVSSPILHDDKKSWDELKKICTFLDTNKSDTQHNAGGHIHVGTNALGNDSEAWKTFFKLYCLYEGILFRFAYGDKINPRNSLFTYAPPVSDLIYPRLEEINKQTSTNEIFRILPLKNKYKAITLRNVSFTNYSNTNWKKTIEFRFPNASSKEVIWQNNINTFVKMLENSKNNSIDTDYLDYKLRNKVNNYNKNQYLYTSINIPEVLEFIDILFDNNKDKIYFLKQYLKDFNEIYDKDINYAVKSKSFVK